MQFASVLGNVGAVQSLLLFGADPEKVREKRGRGGTRRGGEMTRDERRSD